MTPDTIYEWFDDWESVKENKEARCTPESLLAISVHREEFKTLLHFIRENGIRLTLV